MESVKEEFYFCNLQFSDPLDIICKFLLFIPYTAYCCHLFLFALKVLDMRFDECVVGVGTFGYYRDYYP